MLNIKKYSGKTETNKIGYPLVRSEISKQLIGQEFEDLSLFEVASIAEDLQGFKGYVLPPEVEIPDNDFYLPEIPNDNGVLDFIDGQILPDYSSIRADLADFFSRVQPFKGSILRKPYWTFYPWEGTPKPVSHPHGKVVIVDCETYVRGGGFPVMAAAVTIEGWYFWLHPDIIANKLGQSRFRKILIEIGTGHIIVNHNVKFDTILFQETYDPLNPDRNIIIDTMSMHTAVCGMTGVTQNKAYVSWKKGDANYAASWATQTSPASLVEAYNHHVQPLVKLGKGDKVLREIFVKGRLEDIQSELEDLIDYTVEDVWYTFQLAEALWPKYLNSQPHLATLAGHVILGSTFLPVIPDWDNRIQHINAAFDKASLELTKLLSQVAKDLVDDFLSGKLTQEEIDHDPWVGALDWTPAKSGKTKGQPLWWRKLKGKKVTVKSNLAPLLCKLSYNDGFLRKSKKAGWVYRVYDPSYNQEAELGSKLSPELGEEFFAKVPHKKGTDQNCGNPFGKDYVSSFDSGIMKSACGLGKEVALAAKAVSYWASLQSRVAQQKALPMAGFSDSGWRMIEPMLAVHGTATRRTSERLWQTTSGTKDYGIGTELKGLVRCPPGYRFVGADFDAQEMRIAGLFADRFNTPEGLARLGSTPMGYTQMFADKSRKTDSHSQMALSIFLDSDYSKAEFKAARNLSKPLNFSMLYLSGVKTCTMTIKGERVDWPMAECKQKANAAIKLRRGNKVKRQGKDLYVGGTDSQAYNFMMSLGNGWPMPPGMKHLENVGCVPRTPMLGSSMSRAACKLFDPEDDFLTSRANWCIQSSGADILHLFVTLITYLFKVYRVDGRFMLSYHDEVWSMVREDHKYQAAWCFQVAHAWTWAYMLQRLGFKEMSPLYLWFSSVNIDTVFRKEVDDPQVSPSSYDEDVPDGESVTMNSICSKLEEQGWFSQFTQ